MKLAHPLLALIIALLSIASAGTSADTATIRPSESRPCIGSPKESSKRPRTPSKARATAIRIPKRRGAPLPSERLSGRGRHDAHVTPYRLSVMDLNSHQLNLIAPDGENETVIHAAHIDTKGSSDIMQPPSCAALTGVIADESPILGTPGKHRVGQAADAVRDRSQIAPRNMSPSQLRSPGAQFPSSISPHSR